MTFQILEFGDQDEHVPERVLWMAVIERAMLDYCFPSQQIQNKFLTDLHWFFFERKAQQFNLTYICNFLFDDENIAHRIRQRVREMRQTPEAKAKHEKNMPKAISSSSSLPDSTPEMPHTEEHLQQQVQQLLRGHRRRVLKSPRRGDYRQLKTEGGE